MLQLLLIIPLLGALALLPFSTGSQNAANLAGNKPNSSIIESLGLNSEVRMKQVALFASLVNFIISMVLWAQFDSSVSHYQFQEEFTQISFCHLHLGIDGISLYFVLLTTFITPICILSNWHDIKEGLKYFLIAFLVLETLQIAVFVVLDLLLFYIFFESVLIPLFLIVGIWGASEARIRAAFLLFLYTLAGSLFMLLAIMVIYYNVGSTDFTIISLHQISLESQKILWLAFFLAFAVKIPLFPFHIWLPRAHSEAPLAGSILLAAIILKFPVYGIMRILLPILPDATNYFSPLIQTIAIISLVYASLATIIQHDTKALVAYSSVAHMGIIVLGLFSNTIAGIEGAILLSLAHGFASPGLFICVGGVLYNRYHTRTIAYYRGIALTMPVFTILFFLFTMANSGVPLTLNWVGEFLSLTGIFQRSYIGALGASGIVLSACYSFWLYNRVSYGSFSPYLMVTNDVNRREFMLLISLVIPLFLLGIFPNVILDALHLNVSTLLYNTIPSPFFLEASVLSFVPLALNRRGANSSLIKSENQTKDLLNDDQFSEWFSGFSDGESCFSIAEKSNKPFSFEFPFRIELHRDDLPLLEYIQNRLGMGTINSSLNSCTWRVSAQKDILKLIELFNKYPLNTSKQLNFSDWQKAFYLYISLKDKNLNKGEKDKIKAQILKLKAGMNSSREFIVESASHEIKITPYWFLGFIEAESSFQIEKNSFQQTFSIELSIKDKPVIVAIAHFLKELIPSELNHLREKNNLIGLFERTQSLTGSTKYSVRLYFSKFDFISKVFIPFLQELIFLSKKELDFKDWLIVTQLKLKGLHLTLEGKELIKSICNRMNVNRLSTNPDSKNILTVKEQEEIDKKIVLLGVSLHSKLTPTQDKVLLVKTSSTSSSTNKE
nr:NADH dehydrogenase subunit 4 [Rhizoctonia sp.]